MSYSSQLGATSDLLSSIIVAATVRFVETGEFVPGWSLDLWDMKSGGGWADRIKSKWEHAKTRKRIADGIRADRYFIQSK